MKFLLACVLAWLLPFATSAAAQATPSESQKIEQLIASVQNLKGAVFIRNGTEYGGAQAADHLRMKWKKAGGRVKTAEDFIRLCASGSYLSGKKYQIRFADGRIVDSEQFFHEELKKIAAGDRRAAGKTASTNAVDAKH
jgi:hypothetical protein